MASCFFKMKLKPEKELPCSEKQLHKESNVERNEEDQQREQFLLFDIRMVHTAMTSYGQ